jgi:hypothetical protein
MDGSVDSAGGMDGVAVATDGIETPLGIAIVCGLVPLGVTTVHDVNPARIVLDERVARLDA